jgi:hypothetical protein
MFTWILRWGWIERKQLDFEVMLSCVENKRDVLSLHVRHAHVPHVPRRRAAIDQGDVLLPEVKELRNL